MISSVPRLVVLTALAAASLALAAASTGTAPPLSGKLIFSDRVWYDRDGGDSWEVLVGEPGRGYRVRFLTHRLPCGDAYGPDVSGDGQMIAFICRGLWVMGSDGSGKRKLANFNDEGFLTFALSPDHAEIAFNLNGSISIEATVGGHRRKVARATRDASVSWSPDGQEIAFISGGWLWIDTVSDGQLRKVGNGRDLSFVGWSADGQEIDYGRSGKLPGIWTVSITAGAPHRLIRGPVDGDLSPDGQSIAFNRADGVYVMKATGGGVHRLRHSFGSVIAWSPDSTWIATELDSPPAKAGIYVIPAAGGNEQWLYGEGYPSGASWTN
jgi:Tol biopolymer transport system component